jgi:anti-anti-sigma factor
LSTHALINDSEGGFQSIGVVGELDLASARDFEDSVNALNGAAPTIVIDMSECTYIDSSIVAVLIRASRRFGKKLTIVVPEKSALRKIFTILNLEHVLPIEPSIEAARAAER